MTDITIRPAEARDCEAVFALLKQMGYPDTANFAEARFRKLLADPDEYIIVAEKDGVISGFFSMHIIPMIAHPSDFARLSYLCVDENLRSSGIGKILLKKCEEIARERGCNRVELHSNIRRESAHRFYLRENYTDAPKYFVKYLDN